VGDNRGYEGGRGGWEGGSLLEAEEGGFLARKMEVKMHMQRGNIGKGWKGGVREGGKVCKRRVGGRLRLLEAGGVRRLERLVGAPHLRAPARARSV
jgi:hypothetical protein